MIRGTGRALRGIMSNLKGLIRALKAEETERERETEREKDEREKEREIEREREREREKEIERERNNEKIMRMINTTSNLKKGRY